MSGLLKQIPHSLNLILVNFSILKVPLMNNRTKLFFLFIITSLSIQAQQFELIGSPGANGNVIKIAVDPDNPSVVYSSHLHGLFKSEDGGQTAKVVNTGFNNIYTNDMRAFKNGTIIFGDYFTGYHKSSDQKKFLE